MPDEVLDVADPDLAQRYVAEKRHQVAVEVPLVVRDR